MRSCGPFFEQFTSENLQITLVFDVVVPRDPCLWDMGIWFHIGSRHSQETVTSTCDML